MQRSGEASGSDEWRFQRLLEQLQNSLNCTPLTSVCFKDQGLRLLYTICCIRRVLCLLFLYCMFKHNHSICNLCQVGNSWTRQWDCFRSSQDMRKHFTPNGNGNYLAGRIVLFIWQCQRGTNRGSCSHFPTFPRCLCTHRTRVDKYPLNSHFSSSWSQE